VSVEIAEIAAKYRADDLGIRMPGALIVATGQYIGADAVLTGDKRLSRVAPTLVTLVLPEELH